MVKYDDLKRWSLISCHDEIYRIMDIDCVHELVCIINCIDRTMPRWIELKDIECFKKCNEQILIKQTNCTPPCEEDLTQSDKRIMHQRYMMISPIISFISDIKRRADLINRVSEDSKISKQTIRKYLCLFLTYNNITVLAPKRNSKVYQLSDDEKNIRWALNKYFYSTKKHSLNSTYIYMLKEKYCDSSGQLKTQYPSFYQFRYFYRKTKKMQNYYISRNGLSNYQRNNRPLLGESVQAYSQFIGMGLLDATVCDIYLVNEAGNLAGRPLLTACIDAYSGLCCGYSLTWEGGMYSVRNLMINVVTDKQKWCEQFGICIEKNMWDSNQLPSILVSDMGAEYKSKNFEQITELGVTLINLPPYRPELKGTVEKFFDIIQNLYKIKLKGKGVIEPDFQKRGIHDYRKDACLTIEEFEKIIIRCIIYYNCERLLKRFPYTEEMIHSHVKPFSNTIWNWNKELNPNNLITVSAKKIILTLLPRTTGKFSRSGLQVNKIRYKCDEYNYTEKYLSGGDITVAYNPESVSTVWVIDEGKYIPFHIIEQIYANKTIDEVADIKKRKQNIINNEKVNENQSKINLLAYMDSIINTVQNSNNVNIRSISKTRKQEQNRKHIDFIVNNEVLKDEL